jgi:hypothetical protein
MRAGGIFILKLKPWLIRLFDESNTGGHFRRGLFQVHPSFKITDMPTIIIISSNTYACAKLPRLMRERLLRRQRNTGAPDYQVVLARRPEDVIAENFKSLGPVNAVIADMHPASFSVWAKSEARHIARLHGKFRNAAMLVFSAQPYRHLAAKNAGADYCFDTIDGPAIADTADLAVEINRVQRVMRAARKQGRLPLLRPRTGGKVTIKRLKPASSDGPA